MKHKYHHQTEMKIKGDATYAILRWLSEQQRKKEREDDEQSFTFSGC